MVLRLLSLSVFICLLSSSLHSKEPDQDSDTLQLKYANWDLNFSPLKFRELNGFQQYRSELFQRPYLRIGNLGLASRRLDTVTNETGIYSVVGDYMPYLQTERNIKFYQTRRPFTSLHYINGAESEQYFRLMHTQNFNEYGNFSFAYNRITSEGFFVDQFTNHTSFVANYNLQSKNQKFESKAFYSINVLEAQENGGVVLSDNDDPSDNTILLSVNLNEAQSILRGRYVQAFNSYELFNNDSSVIKAIALHHNIAWNRNSRNYDDLVASNSNFYRNEYFNLTNTKDTSHIEEFKNDFGFTILDGVINASYEIRNMNVFQNYIIDRDIHSSYANLKIEDSLVGGNLKIKQKQGLSGFHKAERISSIAFQSKYQSFDYQFLYINQQLRANPLMERHRTNHFFFDLNLDLIKTQMFQIMFNHEESNTRLILSHQSIDNFYYYDSISLPNQFNDKLEVVRVSIQKNFSFLKHFNLSNQITYQSISDQSVLPLPNLSSSHSLFYSNRFFKRSLNFQIGADFSYVASSKGYVYNPALATFHLADREGDLPNIHQLDLFMNLGITEAARIFVKMENVLLPTFSQDSYFVHDQPIPGRALKVGLYWRMIN